ncbi:AAA family ATPase [Bradyrhizobium sp. BRP56]|nr:AAA family ATPase [Bradyrhizobium sp. BRP56]
MLHSLRLRNFRAYRNQSFDFAKINIFVGKNSSGKSSAISAINFLAQSLSQAETSVPIVFNGPFEQLGTFVDIVHGNHVLTPIEFDLTYGDRDVRHRVNFSIKYRPQRREASS